MSALNANKNFLDYFRNIGNQPVQDGATFGNKVYNAQQGGWIDKANPNDPNQFLRWEQDKYTANGPTQLYDPSVMASLKTQLAPYFAEQRRNYLSDALSARNQAVGQAQNQAASYAASQGYNPASFVASAGSRANEQMAAPIFSGLNSLNTNQLGQLLNMAAQSQEFSTGQQNANLNRLMQYWQIQQQLENQPTFLENLFGGLMGAGSQLGSAAILAGGKK